MLLSEKNSTPLPTRILTGCGTNPFNTQCLISCQVVLFGLFTGDTSNHNQRVCSRLTLVILLLLGYALQQGVQGTRVVLQDPEGDAAQEGVWVQPGAVVATAVAVAAQHLLVEQALAGGRALIVGLVQPRHHHGQLQVFHLLQEHLGGTMIRGAVRIHQTVQYVACYDGDAINWLRIGSI